MVETRKRPGDCKYRNIATAWATTCFTLLASSPQCRGDASTVWRQCLYTAEANVPQCKRNAFAV